MSKNVNLTPLAISWPSFLHLLRVGPKPISHRLSPKGQYKYTAVIWILQIILKKKIKKKSKTLLTLSKTQKKNEI